MQRLRIFFLTCALFVSVYSSNSTLLHAQTDTTDRVIYWLHGLNESGYQFWDRYDTLFAKIYKISRPVRSPDLRYSSIGSLDSIARIKVYKDIQLRMYGITTSQNFPPIFIGHSMGGLVARHLVKTHINAPLNTLDLSGGIITVSTPNNGADFVASLSTPLADSIFYHGRDELLAPFPVLNFTFTIATNLATSDPRQIIDSVTLQPLSRVRQIAGITGLDEANGLLEQCTKDMIPNSAFMRNINNIATFPSNVPTISIYGSTKWNSLLRMASSRRQDLTLLPLDVAPENYFLLVAQAVSNAYRTRGLFYSSSAIAFQSSIANNAWGFLLGAMFRWESILFFRGAYYMDYGLQIDWAALIKAQAIKTATYNTPVVNTINIDDSPVWQQNTRLTHFLVKENDGLLSKDTQILAGARRQLKARGANHFTEGNHPSVRVWINEILLTEQDFATLRR